MEKENKKKNTSEINEELMMNLMVDGIKKEGLQIPVEKEIQIRNSKEFSKEKTTIKEKSRSKRASEEDYESIFFKRFIRVELFPQNLLGFVLLQIPSNCLENQLATMMNQLVKRVLTVGSGFTKIDFLEIEN